MERVLVTGGAGFIGSHLVEMLVKLGYGVRVLDNLSRGSEANLVGVRDAVELIRGDVRDREVVEKAVGGVDLVVHLAVATTLIGLMLMTTAVILWVLVSVIREMQGSQH